MHTLIAQLQAAFPSFQSPGAAGQEVSSLTLLEHFARFVVDSFEAGERDSLGRAFEIVEEYFGFEDDEFCSTLTVGFLESLQNIASHRPFGAEAFVQYLGPKTRDAWAELDRLWEDKTNLAEVVAKETGATLDRQREHSPSQRLEQIENPELRSIIEGMTRDNSEK